MLRLPTTIHLPILYGKVGVITMNNEEIVDQIQNGYSVTFNMEILYTSNLPLIRLFLKPYIRLKPQDEEDLLQEAYLGMIDAISHYEPDKGVLFMSYAEHWIKQRARTYISKDKSIRIPGYFKEQINRYKKSVQEYEQLYSRNPSDLDMCEYMSVSLEQIEKLKIWMQDVKSLDDTISCNGDSFSLEETIADDFNLEHTVIDKQYKDYEQQALWEIVDKHVDSEQQSVIKKIYKENKTFKEISQENKISVDEVRKRKENGLRRLRSKKALEEIKGRLETAEANMYHSGYYSYLNNNFTSSTERVAIENVTLKDNLKRIERKLSL